MVKELIRSLLGEKNTARIRRLKSSLNAAKSTWHTLSTSAHRKVLKTA